MKKMLKLQKSIVVHALITNGRGEALILQRSKQNDVLPEYWDLPGGTLQDGEDPAAGAIRETKEETGIGISDLKLFYHTSNVDVEKNTQFITLIFKTACPVANTKVILSPEEHQAFAWVKPEDVDQYKTVEYLNGHLWTTLLR